MFSYDSKLDIRASQDDVLINTVNCVGVMGKGVAKAVADRFPSVLEPYKRACDSGRLTPGLIHIHRVPDGPLIINMATKNHWKDPSRQDWVGSGLFWTSRFLQDEIEKRGKTITSVTLPPPGCGNGGLDWPSVHVMVRACLDPLSRLGVQISISESQPEAHLLPILVAGVGSRKTPPPVLDLMRSVGALLAEDGVTLRSGGAKGADTAFEEGFTVSGGSREIFFKESVISPLHESFTRNLHPNPSALSPVAKQLMNRNGAQVLGAEIDAPVDLVLCWTPSGKGGGGTGQAIRIAESTGIPVLDLGHPDLDGASADQVVKAAYDLIHARRHFLDIPVPCASLDHDRETLCGLG